MCIFESIVLNSTPTIKPTAPLPSPPPKKTAISVSNIVVTVYFPKPFGFSPCSYQLLSIPENIGILLALVCLVIATKTRKLTYCQRERVRAVFASLWFSNFTFHVINSFSREHQFLSSREWKKMAGTVRKPKQFRKVNSNHNITDAYHRA